MLDNLTVVIPFYNGHRYLARLIESIPTELPLVIVDDKSDPPLGEADLPASIAERSLTIIRPKGKGYFAGAVNRAIQETSTDILVLNQDSWFEADGWVAVLEAYRQKYAMIGERIEGEHPSFPGIGYIHGTFMFLRRDAIKAVGELDAKNYPLWGNTAEWQLRAARKGFEILPLRRVPGFRHERGNRRFGDSIQQMLNKEPDLKKWLIRTPPLVSVIVPCYNYGKYLPDCIGSLIGGPTSLGRMPGQTLQSFEVIIVDDQSTDDSAQIGRALADPAKGIRFVQMAQNGGTARALNAGIQQANGQYITFLSADDMREPNALEKLVEACEKNPHSFAYDNIILFHFNQRSKKWKMESYDFNRLVWKNHVHAGILYPKKAWEEVGGYPPSMGQGREDWAFNIALGLKGWCGVQVDNFGYLYRREGQNRSLHNTSPSHREQFLEQLMFLFPEAYKGERPVACCGKKSPVIKNTSTSVVQRIGGSVMAAGTSGMVLVEYTGTQMTSVWSGQETNISYRFGADRRVGWVNSKDVGERGKSGFLNAKDRSGSYVFRLKETVENSPATVEKEPVKETIAETVEKPAASVQEASSQLAITSPSQPKIDAPDPGDLTIREIQELDLTYEQWEEVYRRELAGGNRKGAITFLEEKLADLRENA